MSQPPRLLHTDGLWCAEDLPSWSHAVSSQDIDGRLFNLQVAFDKRGHYYITSLTLLGPLPLSVPCTSNAARYAVDSIWRVDERNRIAFDYLVLEQQFSDTLGPYISAGVSVPRSHYGLIADMLSGQWLHVDVGSERLRLSLDGAASTIDAATLAATISVGGEVGPPCPLCGTLLAATSSRRCFRCKQTW
jgi:hypothetical protein